MGERTLPPGEPAPRRPAPAAILFGIIGLLLLALPIWPGVEADRTQVTAVLAGRSIIQDRDLHHGAEDRRRHAEWASRLEEDDELPLPRIEPTEPTQPIETADVPRYELPSAYAVTLAPLVAVGGLRTAAAIQAAFFIAALFFAGWRLERRLGPHAWGLGVLVLAGTTLFTLVPRLWPETLAAAVVAVAFALSLRGGHGQEALGEIYAGGEKREGRALGRWLVIGLLVGLAIALSPPLVGFLVPLTLTVRARSLRGGSWCLLLGSLLVAAPAIAYDAGLVPAASGGAATNRAEISVDPSERRSGNEATEAIAADRGVVEALFDPIRWDWRLWVWNLAYLGAGRFVGIFFYAVAVLLLAMASTGAQSGRIWLGAALGVVVLLALRPFDVVGAPDLFGPRTLLPFLPVLWLAAERRPPGWAYAAVALWSAALLWPLWIAPGAAPVDEEEARLRYAPPYLSPWSPVTTTAPRLPRGPHVAVGELRVTLLTPGTERADGNGIRLSSGNRPFELLVGAPGAIETLRLETGGDTGVEIEIGAAELGRSIYRPDGGVAFELALEEALVRHPMPGSDRDWHFHRLRIGFPSASSSPTTVRIARGPLDRVAG